MAGIMPQGMPVQAPVPAQAPAQTPPQARTADPKDAYTRVVLAAGKVIYENDETAAGVLQMLQSQDDPAKALAYTVTAIMSQLNQKAGGKIPPGVVLPAAMEVLAMCVRVADAAGLFKVDDAVAKTAAQLIVAQLIREFRVPREEAQAFMQSVGPKQAAPAGVSPSVRQAGMMGQQPMQVQGVEND